MKKKKINSNKNIMNNQNLHGWWGLSYASFLTLPRVLMQEMPNEWQEKMAELLHEYEDTFDTSELVGGTQVRATNLNGKLIPMPEDLINYRHPNYTFIDSIKINRKRIKP